MTAHKSGGALAAQALVPPTSITVPFGLRATSKIQAIHFDRLAIVYVRQSSPQQVVENRESRERQYALAQFAQRLGWPTERVLVIAEDQGITDNKKLHTLRKELGSVLAKEQDIFAAQHVLRHAHIQTTAKHYTDKRRTITGGLGRFWSLIRPTLLRPSSQERRQPQSGHRRSNAPDESPRISRAASRQDRCRQGDYHGTSCKDLLLGLGR